MDSGLQEYSWEVHNKPVPQKQEEFYQEYRPELEETNPVVIRTTKGRMRYLAEGKAPPQAFITRLRHNPSGVVKDVIVQPHNATIGTRLHEVSHYLNKDVETYSTSWDSFALSELRAELFQRKTRDKNLTMRELKLVGRQLIDDGCSPSRAMTALKNALSTLGYSLPKELSSKVWWFLRDRAKEDRLRK